MKSDFEKFVEEIESSRKNYWERVYPNMSLEEKQRYWLASTHRGMRTQGEATADEYSEFSKKWYEFAKEHEPNFDKIFEYVAENLRLEFDWNEYRKRIQE